MGFRDLEYACNLKDSKEQEWAIPEKIQTGVEDILI